MPMRLKGSCRCGAVSFTLDSHTPYPYQLCYCSICRKTGGGGGYAINIMGDFATLKVKTRGRGAKRIYHAEIDGDVSSCQRHFCARCATALWVYDKAWPELVHPFASAIDTELPKPPSKVHLLLKYKASWVVPDVGRGDKCFDGYPEQSIEDWHRSRGLWIE
jgi:hypothetical protein